MQQAGGAAGSESSRGGGSDGGGGRGGGSGGGSGGGGASAWTLTVQSTAAKFTVEVPADQTIGGLKELIKDRCSCPPAQQRIIHRGRVLKDDTQTLAIYGVENGHTVHVVRGAAPTTQAAAPAPAAAPSDLLGNLMGAGAAGAAGMPDTQRMQQQFAQNPEMMQSIMNSPMVQSLMDNPEMLRAMMTSNPQMRALLDANPQLNHVLNDPAVLRQTMEMARNPAAMQQAIRNQDLAMSHIENIPGGFNALTRMYHDVQEPMMEAAMANQSSPDSASSGAVSQEGALPNPWATPPAPSAAPPPGGSGGSMSSGPSAAGPNPFGMPPVAGMPPNLGAMMQNPAMQSMMQQMMSDPVMMQQMIDSNPMLRQMMDANPQMRSMLSDPAFLQMATNPAVMQAMQSAQMPQAGQGAQAGFPLFFPPPPGAFGAPALPAAGTAANGAPNVDFGNLLSNMGVATYSSGPPPPAPASWLDESPQPSGASSSSTSGSASTATPPEPTANARYATQLTQLQNMGFSDEAANLEALAQSGGNLNAAVERLLGGLEG